MRALVVVPTYNEKENIRSLLEAVLAVTPKELDVLVVDDGSPDGTGDIVRSMLSQRVHLLSRSGKLGLGTAYVAGFKWGLERGYDVFIEMDADFSHDPKYLPIHLELLTKKDFVIGSRYVEDGGTLNWGILRKIISRGGSYYSQFILGAPIQDFTGGFNSWHRKVLEAVDLESLRSDGYSFQIELKYRAFCKGFAWQEFPIVFEDRKVGKSKMSSKIVLEALVRVWSFRFKQQRKLLT